MMDGQFFYDLVGQYGIYAIFFLAMVEGDITLLLAGVLAQSGFFGEHSFAKVLTAGTLGGIVGDNLAYSVGYVFHRGVRKFRFYTAVSPRIEKLTSKFGTLAIFLSKYIYGLRTGSCIFYGVARMPYSRFLLLTSLSCWIWVSILSGIGYFFSSLVINLLGDFQRLGVYLLIIVVCVIVGFYLLERFWLSARVENADANRLHELETAAHERLHGLSHEIHSYLVLARRKEAALDDQQKRSPRLARSASNVKGRS